jgi:two-component system nitrogen regulation response regulator NtrX
MQSILVVDDESGIRSAVKDILEDERYRVFTAEDGVIGLDMLKTEPIQLVILDIWLPRMGGMDVLKEIKKTYPEIEVIIISGHANIDMAVQAVKLGAFDFIEKPLSIDRILTATRNAASIIKLKEENRKLKKAGPESEEVMIAESPAMLPIRNIIKQAAASDTRILITGENGTGKELVARAVHNQSERSDRAFVEVNCAAIPDTLIESELFGHEKGAFTDAVSRRKGKFEQAHGGTIFLDEIADMSLHAQAKVLRAIQELKFERLGSEEPISVDVRIIAATNKNLQEEIAAGRFREDLFFRLNVIPIRLPALRERVEDIPLLVNHFLKTLEPQCGRKRFSKEAMAVLIAFPWPGNVRELKNVVERVAVMSPEETISADVLELHMSRSPVLPKASEANADLSSNYAGMKLGDAKDFFEKSFIDQKLKENGYNITRTAEILGIYPSNLHAKLKKYGIQVER